jgi:hypothetical protein
MLIPTESFGSGEDLSNYLFDQHRIRVRCEAKMGVLGVEGDLALWIPPADHDEDDLWEASRKAGEHDWWSFLQFQTVPNGNDSAPELILFYAHNTFLERNLAIVKRLPLANDSFDCSLLRSHLEIGDELEEQTYLELKQLFGKYLNAEVVDDGSWLTWD